MAAAVGIHFTANNPLINHRRESENTCLNHNAPVGPSSGSISRSINLDLSKRCRRGRMTMKISAAAAAAEMGIAKKAAERKDQNAAVVYEKMDEWMRDSVVDIVKNLREAPLLVHVYSNNNNKDSIKTTTEKTVEEQDWTDVIEKWKAREMPLPDGVIFVEQLIDNNEEEEEESKKVKEEITRAWGIVVQGRGVDCGPICYLLKTSRVSGGGGFGGLCCATHFCLMRVKSFRECARSQLQKCWLSSSSSS